MKVAQITLNMALSESMNLLRLHRWINQHLAPGASRKSGERRYRMAYRANGQHLEQNRLIRFNGFRNPRRCRQTARPR